MTQAPNSRPATATLDHLAFYLSLFFSRLADQVLLFLVPLVVFQTTQSVAWSGIAFFAETLPRFLAFAVCGALCDRVPPLKLLHTSQIYRALACVVGVAAFALLGGLGWLVALSAVCGVLTTQGVMAREVMLPQIFPNDRFEKVLAHAQIADQLGMVLGPLLAALALGWWRWEWVVAATAVLFLLADATLALWRRASTVQLKEPQAAPGHWTQPVRTALWQVWHLPGLKKQIALASGVNLVVGVTLATCAAMVTGMYQRKGADYAVLQTAGAVVTVLVLLFIARSALPLKVLGALSFVSIFLGGVLTAIGGSVWVYVAGFLLVIGFDKMFNVYIRSSRQKIIPQADYGKTTGVMVLLNNASQPLAGLVVGLFASRVDTGVVIAALTLCMGLLGAAVVLGRGGR
jgi:MFS family permease